MNHVFFSSAQMILSECHESPAPFTLLTMLGTQLKDMDVLDLALIHN